MISEASNLCAYRRYARSYDRLFGRVFEDGRRSAIAALRCALGDSILEVGVGTGISLPLYPDSVRVTGIDLSPDMLDVARSRITEDQLGHAQLALMDAQNMAFPDNSFDKAVCMYVASVVPSPMAMVAELKRVCRPGADIIFLNHFRSERGVARWLEYLCAPFSGWLGFNPTMCREEFTLDLRLEIVAAENVNLCGYWTLLHTRNQLPRSETQCGYQEVVQTLPHAGTPAQSSTLPQAGTAQAATQKNEGATWLNQKD